MEQNCFLYAVDRRIVRCWRRVTALELSGVLGRTVRLATPAAIGRGVNVMGNLRMQ